MAEVLIILAVAAEVAEDVKIIADAIHSVVDLVDALRGKKVVATKEILERINKMQNELETLIHEQEMREHLELVYAAGVYWYDRLLPQVSADGLSPESINGPLQFVMGALEDHVSNLTRVVYFFNDRTAPSAPEDPRVLSSILLCISLLQNLLIVYRQAYYALRGTARQPILGDRISRGLSALEKWVVGYRAKRSALLDITQLWEDSEGRLSSGPPPPPRPGEPKMDVPPEEPWPTNRYIIDRDYAAGDDLLPRLEGREYYWDGPGGGLPSPFNARYLAVDSYWGASTVGSTIPGVVAALNGLAEQANELSA